MWICNPEDNDELLKITEKSLIYPLLLSSLYPTLFQLYIQVLSYTVSKKKVSSFLKIKNISDHLSVDKEGKIMRNIDLILFNLFL